MIEKLFVKNSEDIENPVVRNNYGTFASIFGIVCNLLLVIGKGLVGIIFNSISIIADAINNLSDASSNIVSFLGFKLANKPADEDHPYGHGRYEYLASFVVAMLIMVVGFELFKTGIEKIITPEETTFSIITICVLVASILVKFIMMLFYKRIGKKINSQTLIATSNDSRNDMISTTVVLIGALISHFFNINLDGYLAVAVAIFILVSGFMLIKDTLDPLLGVAPDDNFVHMIKTKVMSYDGVLGVHDLIIHDYGPGRKFASVHVEMSDEMPPLVSHEIIDTIERDFLKDEKLHIVIHYDPISSKDELVKEMRESINNLVKTIDNRMSIHDLRIVEGENNTNAIFDCVIPRGFDKSESEIKEKVTGLVKAKYPKVSCVITVEESYLANK